MLSYFRYYDYISDFTGHYREFRRISDSVWRRRAAIPCSALSSRAVQPATRDDILGF